MPNKKNARKKLFDFTGASKVTLDYDKYKTSREIYLTGLNNFTLFQKFSNFRWPAWINAITDTTRGVAAFAPFMLVNSAMRDCLYFTNLLSEEGLYVDPSGMISPSFGNWSMEMWIIIGGELYRPAEDWTRVRLERDVKNSVIFCSWENDLFKLKYSIFGARSAVDEAIVETECLIKERKQASLLFVVRPYDQYHLGGLSGIEFSAQTRSFSINGAKIVCFNARPDYLASGDGARCRDIDPHNVIDKSRNESTLGMATLGAGYSLKKGENRFSFRMAMDAAGGLSDGKYDYAKAREDYVDFSGLRIQNGANAAFPEKLLQNWFYGSKIALLNYSDRNITGNNGRMDYRAAYFIMFGFNRMGYFSSTLRCIDHFVKSFAVDEKNISFDGAIDVSYVINALSDYFMHVRDIGFIQDRFQFIKNLAHVLLGYARKIKIPGTHERNSIPNYSIAEDHPYDCLLIAHAMSRYAYLARCLGIFGEELTFKQESERVAKLYVDSAFSKGIERTGTENEFIAYNLYAGFPFRLEQVSEAMLKGLFDRMRAYFSEMPLFIKSLGVDVQTSLVAAINLVMMKDMRGYEIVDKLMRIKNKTYVLPEFMNPATSRANWGEGASMTASAMMFAAIRNLVFVDYPERLDVFPLPRPEWFEPGNEIRVEDAPSRFGPVSIRMVSTVNEIQVHFDKLPKFVPPDIMINLPYKTKIKQEDDFILKREGDNSFVINGWPSIVRFIRK